MSHKTAKFFKEFTLNGATLLSLSIIVGIFSWIIGDLVLQGFKGLHSSFLFEAPLNAGRAGGIRPVLTSTSIIVGICLIVSFPISFSVALMLSEKILSGHKVLKILHSIIMILSGVPSVVFGLFGNVYFCEYLGLGYSMLSGGLTLACMILPLSIKLLEESIRSVPNHMILSARSLGIGHITLIRSIILPQIAPQLTAAYILSLARALAEIAALLFTSGYVMRDPQSIFDSGRTLSIHIYDLTMNVTGSDQSAYQTAFVLLVFLLTLNLLGHGINYLWKKFQYGM